MKKLLFLAVSLVVFLSGYAFADSTNPLFHKVCTCTISATNGKELLLDQCGKKALFFRGEMPAILADSDLKPTAKITVKVNEVAKEFFTPGTIGGWNISLDKVSFTQGQVFQFCKEHGDLLTSKEVVTAFLLKVRQRYCVAYVGRSSSGLTIEVLPLGGYGDPIGDRRIRYVIPKQYSE